MINKTHEFKNNLTMAADLIDGLRPEIGTKIPAYVAKIIFITDVVSEVQELRAAKPPRQIFPIIEELV